MKLTIGRLVFGDHLILFKKWKLLIQHGSFNNLRQERKVGNWSKAVHILSSRPGFLSSGCNNAIFSEVTKMHSAKYLLTKEAIKEAASNATVIFETLIGSSEQCVLWSSLDMREASERARNRNEWRMIVTQF